MVDFLSILPFNLALRHCTSQPSALFLGGFPLLPGDEFYAYGVNAVARILFRKALAFENVAQVAFAVVANDFYPPSVRIPDFLDRASYFIIEARPAATRAEFVLTIVQWGIAAPANVDAVHLEVIVFVVPRHLGAFVDDHTLFFLREGVVVSCRFHTRKTHKRKEGFATSLKTLQQSGSAQTNA